MIPVSRDLPPSQAGRTCQSLNGLPKCPVLRAKMMTSNDSDGAHCRHFAIDSTLPFIDPAARPECRLPAIPGRNLSPGIVERCDMGGKGATTSHTTSKQDTARSKKWRGLRG